MKKHYVYELINFMGTVEDVGETIKPKLRMYQHTKNKRGSGCGKYYGRQDLVMNIVAEFDNRKDALLLEGKLKLEYGLPWTEKQRDIKGGILGSIHGKKQSKSVIVHKTDGSFIGEYYSLNECARVLNLNVGVISLVCNGKCKQTKGYIIKYK